MCDDEAKQCCLSDAAIERDVAAKFEAADEPSRNSPDVVDSVALVVAVVAAAAAVVAVVVELPLLSNNRSDERVESKILDESKTVVRVECVVVVVL